ncbi:MAG TPA: hypothetical protein PKL70_16310, partial [Saprospiraceae bacterium]|nr:hypothetical protein [Saprospiraceae bacterium]
QIPGNTSWKFIPKSYSFTDVQNPWGYPTEEQLDKMQETEVRDFVGVKIGDLNSSAVPHSLIGTEVRGNDIGLTLETEDRVVRKGEEVSVTFRSPNFRGISGWQGTLHTGGLQYLGVRQAGKLDLTEEHIGRRWAGEGMLTMSWHHHTGLDLDEETPLFTLVFRAGVDGRLSEMLRFGSQHTIAESYEGKGELGGLSLHFVAADGNAVASRSELYQNYPNPFDQRTVIGINLAKEGKGVLRILDITGRTLRSFEREWSKGYQEVWLDRREIGATGVLHYRFESEFFTASRKMMIVD